MSAPAFTFRLSESPIDVGLETMSLHGPQDGAVASFVGVVRNVARGQPVVRLDYEAYGSMAETEMQAIFETMRQRFAITGARVVHRVGTCRIGDPSIVIVVAAPHRAAAFDACRYCIDRLKETVPIWKHEYYENGAAWIGERS